MIRLSKTDHLRHDQLWNGSQLICTIDRERRAADHGDMDQLKSEDGRCWAVHISYMGIDRSIDQQLIVSRSINQRLIASGSITDQSINGWSYRDRSRIDQSATNHGIVTTSRLIRWENGNRINQWNTVESDTYMYAHKEGSKKEYTHHG
jgi:hypothetical protein